MQTSKLLYQNKNRLSPPAKAPWHPPQGRFRSKGLCIVYRYAVTIWVAEVTTMLHDALTRRLNL